MLRFNLPFCGFAGVAYPKRYFATPTSITGDDDFHLLARVTSVGVLAEKAGKGLDLLLICHRTRALSSSFKIVFCKPPSGKSWRSAPPGYCTSRRVQIVRLQGSGKMARALDALMYQTRK